MLCALEPSQRLNQVINCVNQMDSGEDFMLLTGDLSYHGMEPAYRTLRDILEPLDMPCHLMIGTHDDRESFKRIFPETPTDPDGFGQYTVETVHGAFIMLDSP